MKNLGIFYSVLFFFCNAFSQNKIATNSGTIFFEASLPAFEEVKANNNNVSCVVNTTTGEISSLAFISEFQFKMAMMEEHFNANYLESSKYPKATFKGNIHGFNLAIIGNVPKDFILTGKLSMHGKSKNISTIARIQKTQSGLQIATNFKVNTSDFGIKIPKIVQYKIAETVTIKANFEFKDILLTSQKKGSNSNAPSF
ncbi:Lipid/polyisoprenoid-binding, YceI-like [Flavobacteriaceae bacterium]